MNTSLKLSKQLSFGEEIANSVPMLWVQSSCLSCCLFHPSIVMKHTDFYPLSAFPFSSSVSFSCSYHPPFITLWPMVRPTNMFCESLTIL